MNRAEQGIPASNRRPQLWLALFLFALFAALLAQFYRIQVIQADYWKGVADRQHHFWVREPFMRGTFLADERRLALDIEKYHLFVDPQAISEDLRTELAQELTRRFGLNEGWVMEQLEKRSRSRHVCSWLDREQRADLLQWWHPWARAHRVARNAIYFTTDYQRSYPFGSLLGPVLHTIQDRKDDVTLQATPTGGLELQFNSLLSGKLGRRRLVRSPRNALETEDIIEAPENGADVYLTIDLGLQALCEREISKAVKDAGAQAGWAVMMDPSSGEILALAQYPYFDPARYREYYNDPDKAWMTKVKAITDAFEPGSTIKPLTMAVALEANREAVARKKAPYFTPTEKITSSDGRFPGRGKPIKDVRTHSYLNMYMALQRSSNIYMARVMDRVVKGQGEGWYRDQLSRCFGFGAPTGIELPAESAGVLPTPGVASTGWSQATVHSMSFGYNLQVTSLQMLRAYGILANGGYWIDPTLVRKATKRHDDGTAEVVWSPPVERPARQKRVLHEDSVAEVVKGMRYASKAGGAAHRGDLPGYTQAAKTGTTKKIVDGAYSSEKYFSTFVGFAPVSDPKLVLLVAIDEPAKVYRPGQGMGYYGGVCAAPVFRKIATQALEYMGVAEDDPFGYPVGDPRYDAERAEWAQEAKALCEQYDEWNAA